MNGWRVGEDLGARSSIKLLLESAPGEITLEDFTHIWGDLAEEFQCTCGYRFNPYINISMYPHDGGLRDCHGKRWWVYITCPRCHYQWAYWKILRHLKLVIRR